MPRLPLLALASLLLLAVAAPSASAAPGDRAAAAAIRQATIDLHYAVVAQTPGIRASFRQFAHDPKCSDAIDGVPEDQADLLVGDFLFPVLLEMEVVPLQRGFNQFVVELDAVATNDPKLRSGRAGWRVIAATFARIAAPPADVCGTLDAWRQAGYPSGSRPAVSDPTLDDLVRNDDKFNALDAKIERAGRRLRELGVSKRVVDWYTLTTLLDGIDPDQALD
jgi:hypothetical protein